MATGFGDDSSSKYRKSHVLGEPVEQPPLRAWPKGKNCILFRLPSLSVTGFSAAIAHLVRSCLRLPVLTKAGPVRTARFGEFMSGTFAGVALTRTSSMPGGGLKNESDVAACHHSRLAGDRLTICDATQGVIAHRLRCESGLSATVNHHREPDGHLLRRSSSGSNTTLSCSLGSVRAMTATHFSVSLRL
jgi:hypothetical protein